MGGSIQRLKYLFLSVICLLLSVIAQGGGGGIYTNPSEPRGVYIYLFILLFYYTVEDV